MQVNLLNFPFRLKSFSNHIKKELLFATFMKVIRIPLEIPFIDQMSWTKYDYLQLNLIKTISSK